MEIVAPAGDQESLYAAVAAGADSIYLGLKGFGARRNAENFNIEELIKNIDYCHARGVKLFLTLNTIMRDAEIEALYPNLKRLYEEGMDAVIIQDWGLFKFLKDNFPDWEIHASTQMTVTTARECNFLQKEGFERVVLSRELSFDKISEIKKNSGLPLEIFVSGAMCVCYSGKCYMSSFIGGRSGNRGMCAQPCRKNYISSDKEGFFISPKDQLMGVEEIKKLKEIGVESIKIEGRMKDSRYVYAAVKYYRGLLDGINAENRVIKLFNRGYGTGYFYGREDIINPDYSSDFGVRIAEKRGREFLFLEDARTGDGVSFISRDGKIIDGGYINSFILKNGQKSNSVKKGELAKINAPHETLTVNRNLDKEQNDAIDAELAQAERKKEVKVKVIVENGKNILVFGTVKEGKTEYSGNIIEKAQKNILTNQDIESIFKETGNTPFSLGNIEIVNDGLSFISFKELKNIRRQFYELMEKELVSRYKRKAENTPVTLEAVNLKPNKIIESNSKIQNEKQTGAVEKLSDRVYKSSTNGLFYSKKDLLCATIDDIIGAMDGGNTFSIDVYMNIFNSYAVEYFAKFKGIETIYLSQEISISELKKLKTGYKNLGLVIYGKPRVMVIETDEPAKTEYLRSDKGDNYRISVSKNKKSEIYSTKPIDIRKMEGEIEEYGIAAVRYDFTDESAEEARDIINGVEITEHFYPGNYIKGVL